MLNWTCSHLCLWKISIFWTTGCNFENYHLGDSASRLLGSVTVKLDNLIFEVGRGGRKQAYCRIDYRNYVSALFQANFPRNICNISFRVFYVEFFFARELFCYFWSKLGAVKKLGTKFPSLPTSSYFDRSMFSDTAAAGEKAEQSLPLAWDELKIARKRSILSILLSKNIKNSSKNAPGPRL